MRFAWVSLMLTACGAAPLPDTAPLRFEPCGEVECARAEVPLDWSCAGGACETPRVEVIVRRARVPAPRGQLWALDGGPGFAGDGFFDPAFVALVHAAGYDLYVPTHRGAPGGDVLECPDAEASDTPGGRGITEAELPTCRVSLESVWGDLGHFGSAAAGRDVAHLLTRVADVGHVALFGGSYGTLWAQRVLQAAPDAVELAWLDSVVDLEATLENADTHADLAARTLLAQCEASGVCPIDTARAEAVLAADDVCGAPTAELRALGFRLLSGDVQERLVYVLALAAAERCAPSDRAALERALARLHAPPPAPSAPGPRYAPLLNQQIVAAELDGGEAPSPQTGLLASRDGDVVVRARNDAWGATRVRGSLDAITRTRLVLWSGALDPLDPPAWAERTATRWGAERILVESAGHAVMRYARTEGENCAKAIFRALLADPSAAIDRSCLADVEPIDWRREAEATRAVVASWLGEWAPP